MEEKFILLFKETMEDEEIEVNLDTRFRDLDGWDSLTFLSVLAMIDEEYDLVIEGNDFQKLETIEDVINEIKKSKG